MKIFDSTNCGNIGPEQFGNLVDLMLVSATAQPMTSVYPVEFGKDDGIASPRIIQVDQDFGVLTDWKGRVLTQGFEVEE
ncbi:MAG: hypothetical protein E2O82_03650 [Betaproteobacteria bacterium]|nr:MAG: hypothetical protein E2O82_03650 [Betaproteobacteria bacterium]